ncbi:MAG: tetratricopeptide repeat protein [Acidobacteriota bacterium]
MNRDSLLFLLLGILIGFVTAYLALEAVSDRQPQRRVHGGEAVAGAAPDRAGLVNPGQVNPGQVGAGSVPTPPPGAMTGGGPTGAPMAFIQNLRQRLAANPNDDDALLQLANANFDIREYSRAAELYQRYVELVPNNADVLSDLGITYRALNRPQEALAAFERALAVDGQHWLSLFNKAVVLLDSGDLDGAQAQAEVLRGIQPQDPNLVRLQSEIDRRRAG